MLHCFPWSRLCFEGWIPGSQPGDDDKKIKCPGMTCTAGAWQVDNIVPQRPRCSVVFYGRDCALKGGSPGRSPGMTIKKHNEDKCGGNFNVRRRYLSGVLVFPVQSAGLWRRRQPAFLRLHCNVPYSSCIFRAHL